MRRRARLLLARLDLAPDDRVLDVGCGDGLLARLLAPRLPRGAVVGIDADGEAIRAARRLSGALDNALFAPAPAERIPWAEDYFTHVIALQAACARPSPERAAQEIFRVTAYGGRFHLLLAGPEQSPPAPQLESAGQWAALFAAAGFARVAAERLSADPPRGEALYLSGRKTALTESGGGG